MSLETGSDRRLWQRILYLDWSMLQRAEKRVKSRQAFLFAIGEDAKDDRELQELIRDMRSRRDRYEALRRSFESRGGDVTAAIRYGTQVARLELGAIVLMVLGALAGLIWGVWWLVR